MSTMPFRFGLQATPQNGEQWLGLARRAEDLGYSSLLMADGLQLPSPLPALAMAAGATTALRVGTFVLASPLRPPRVAAWDAHSLSALTGGRVEFGIGTGRPEVVEQAVRDVGMPATSAARRLALAEEAIDELRALDGDSLRTPVIVAAGGPRARALAAAKADIVTLAVGPLAARAAVARLAAEVRDMAAARGRQVELAMPVFVVGDEAPPWVRRFLQADMTDLIERESLMVLRGSPAKMASELARRRDSIGISYVTVNGAFAESFAPVIELLAGR